MYKIQAKNSVIDKLYSPHNVAGSRKDFKHNTKFIKLNLSAQLTAPDNHTLNIAPNEGTYCTL